MQAPKSTNCSIVTSIEIEISKFRRNKCENILCFYSFTLSLSEDNSSYYIHFEITGGPCDLIGSNGCDLFMNRTIFCSKSHLFSANEEVTLKTKQPIRFQGLFKVTNQIAGK